ncbi:rhamnulokinase [Paenibacillus bouchesdurhonensis]|uniref:rhamnulokinase n=1 Tax=Paenibacillus bouchesdurhonensis TaxID=1870990 RepID=UPI000DA613DE|nr:rhamnulokinase [Paenibacillus bouchesdurhonensis]
MNNYIAVDIGASSGRLVKGTLHKDSEQIQLQEIHRFSNSFTEKKEHHYWDVDYLFMEIVKGLQKAKKEGVDACTLGIDTWAVDYVLLDENEKRIHEVYAYRDGRTKGAPDELHQKISRSEVYSKTGIQEQPFNTLYQLYVHDSNQLSQADKIVLVPDYLYYRLSGKLMNEVTNASTMQLLNLDAREFDEELLELLDLRRGQFAELTEPGVKLGRILPELQRKYGLPDCELIVIPTHDTASAVAGVPVQTSSPWAYISSGTWSLLGVERLSPLNTSEAMDANYTNEWGAYGTYRFLKNIMGLWMIQEVRRETQEDISFAELVELALREESFRYLVHCNDNRFLNPSSMSREIQNYCLETGQPSPDSAGKLARCIFDSLALTYKDSILELQKLTDQSIETLHIVGGGANNELLCQLTADVAQVEVLAGPTEATALGNIVVQIIGSGQLNGLEEARRFVGNSFHIKKYKPQLIQGIDDIASRWEQIKAKANQSI